MSIGSYKDVKVPEYAQSQIFLSGSRELMGRVGDVRDTVWYNTPHRERFSLAFALVNITRNIVREKNTGPFVAWKNDSYLVV